MAFYAKHDYWQERYALSTEPYEWYQSYHGIRQLFTPCNLSAMHGLNPAKPRRILETREYIPRTDGLLKRNFPSRSNSRVLILGCGNSRLGEDMIRDGWTGGLTCIDWSEIVIQQMNARYTSDVVENLTPYACRGCTGASETKPTRQLMEFVCADVLQGLPFPSCSFDLIVCKGMFDAIVSGAGAFANARQVNEECHRLLNADHGAMVVITHGSPESRIVYLENPGKEWWGGVGIHNLTKPHIERHHFHDRDGTKFHYAYICRKNANNTSDCVAKCVEMTHSSDDENGAKGVPSAQH